MSFGDQFDEGSPFDDFVFLTCGRYQPYDDDYFEADCPCSVCRGEYHASEERWQRDSAERTQQRLENAFEAQLTYERLLEEQTGEQERAWATDPAQHYRRDRRGKRSEVKRWLRGLRTIGGR